MNNPINDNMTQQITRQKGDERYNKVLSITDLVFLGLSMTIGSGIFVLIDDVAKYSKNLMWLATLMAGIMSLFTAFGYGELASIFRNNMGEAGYISSVTNNTIGNIAGIAILISDVFIISTVALGLGNYISTLSGWKNTQAIAIVAIIILNYLNYKGIKTSSTISKYGLFIKVIALLIIIMACFMKGKPQEKLLNMKGITATGLSTASIIALFAYLGFNNITNFTDETINPAVNIGKAISYTVIIVTILYTLLAVATLYVITSGNLSKSSTPLATIAGKIFGKYGFLFVTLLAIVSLCDTLLVTNVSESRYIHALFSNINPIFGKYDMDPHNRTPYFSIIFLVIASAMVIYFLKYIGKTAIYGDILIMIVFIIVNIVVITLRYKYPDQERPFKVPFNVGKLPVPSVIAIIISCYTIYKHLTK